MNPFHFLKKHQNRCTLMFTSIADFASAVLELLSQKIHLIDFKYCLSTLGYISSTFHTGLYFARVGYISFKFHIRPAFSYILGYAHPQLGCVSSTTRIDLIHFIYTCPLGVSLRPPFLQVKRVLLVPT